jgi:hypothetical protein
LAETLRVVSQQECGLDPQRDTSLFSRVTPHLAVLQAVSPLTSQGGWHLLHTCALPLPPHKQDWLPLPKIRVSKLFWLCCFVIFRIHIHSNIYAYFKLYSAGPLFLQIILRFNQQQIKLFGKQLHLYWTRIDLFSSLPKPHCIFMQRLHPVGY